MTLRSTSLRAYQPGQTISYLWMSTSPWEATVFRICRFSTPSFIFIQFCWYIHTSLHLLIRWFQRNAAAGDNLQETECYQAPSVTITHKQSHGKESYRAIFRIIWQSMFGIKEKDVHTKQHTKEVLIIQCLFSLNNESRTYQQLFTRREKKKLFQISQWMRKIHSNSRISTRCSEICNSTR